MAMEAPKVLEEWQRVARLAQVQQQLEAMWVRIEEDEQDGKPASLIEKKWRRYEELERSEKRLLRPGQLRTIARRD